MPNKSLNKSSSKISAVNSPLLAVNIKLSKANRKYGGLSLDERKKQRRSTFLKAGLCVFGTLGYRQASVRRLCQEAKLTDRYFYEACGGLETLLVDVYQQCMTKLSKKILHAVSSEYRQSKNPETAIIAGLDLFFEELENQQVARVCMIELEGLNPEVTQLYNRYIEGFADMLRQLANHAFPNMTTPLSEQKIIALSLVGAMRQAATSWLANDYASDRSELVSASSKLFLGIIRMLQKNT
jgi:AcrR family transcriptional regulator